jgi:hypothetical protein
MLTPRNATIACATWQRGCVSPMGAITLVLCLSSAIPWYQGSMVASLTSLPGNQGRWSCQPAPNTCTGRSCPVREPSHHQPRQEHPHAFAIGIHDVLTGPPHEGQLGEGLLLRTDRGDIQAILHPASRSCRSCAPTHSAPALRSARPAGSAGCFPKAPGRSAPKIFRFFAAGVAGLAAVANLYYWLAQVTPQPGGLPQWLHASHFASQTFSRNR